MTDYVFDNAWQEARRRLALMERALDPGTVRRLERIGVGAAWRCLEVGAGGGSIAEWLAARVGPAGRVVATDIDTRFLEPLAERQRGGPLAVLRHDLARDPLPTAGPDGAGFDLIHARSVLLHLPEREALLGRLAGALAPGGWLLVEDFHDYPGHDPASVQGRAGEESRRIAERVGISADWGRRLPERLCALGLEPVEAEAEVMVYRGGSELAEFWRLSYRQLRDHVAAAGGATPGVDAMLPLFDDRGTWFQGPVVMAAWGRQPARGAEAA